MSEKRHVVLGLVKPEPDPGAVHDWSRPDPRRRQRDPAQGGRPGLDALPVYIAADYGVTLTTVHNVIKRRTWRHRRAVDDRG
jgi:hypothetical protein